MAQMNKKSAPAANSRLAELETDLIGETMQSKQMIETGRRGGGEGTAFQEQTNKRDSMFYIQSGFRRRHPQHVLSNYNGVRSTTSSASDLFEEALVYETEKVNIPQEFRPKGDSGGMTNQMGLVTTAMDNYKASKNKLQRMHLVGS